MLLFEYDPAEHPTLAGLSAEALWEWLSTVERCSLIGSDILEARDLGGATPEIVDEWVRAALAKKEPFGSVRLLKRGSFWEFDRR